MLVDRRVTPALNSLGYLLVSPSSERIRSDERLTFESLVLGNLMLFMSTFDEDLCELQNPLRCMLKVERDYRFCKEVIRKSQIMREEEILL